MVCIFFNDFLLYLQDKRSVKKVCIECNPMIKSEFFSKIYLLLCEQAKATIRNEGNIDSDTSSPSFKSTLSTDKEEETDSQFDEPERAELTPNIFIEDDDVSFVIANVILISC